MNTASFPGPSASEPVEKSGCSGKSVRSLGRGGDGFTLVELLVVIVILGLLAALAFPAVNKALDRAHATGCASNLRQVGLAFQNYANDHDGALPPPFDSTKLWPFGFWTAQIAPYAGIEIKTDSFESQLQVYSGIFRCPGKKDWKLNGAGVTDSNRVSYGMNSFDSENTAGIVKRLVAMGTLTRTMLVADTAHAFPVLPNSYYMYRDFPALRHQKKDNVLFCDGHVEAVPVDGLDYGLVRQ